MKTSLLIIISTLVFSGFFLPVFGLSCDMRSVQYQYDQNEVVFEGTPVQVRKSVEYMELQNNQRFTRTKNNKKMNREQMVNQLREDLSENVTLLVKGSRSSRMDKVVEALVMPRATGGVG